MDALLKLDRKISAKSETAFHTHLCVSFATGLSDCLTACLSSQVRGWVLAPVPGMASSPEVHDCQMGAHMHTGGGVAAYTGRVIHTLQTPTREFSRPPMVWASVDILGPTL